MRIGLKFALLLVSVFGFASFCSAVEWKEFVGAQKVELIDSVSEMPAAFYLSLDGNDEWSGRLSVPNADKTDGPFRSFDRARSAVKEYRASAEFDGSPTVVEVLPGKYELEKTIQFDESDSGTPDSPIVWRGVKGEDGKPAAFLRGGRTLSGAKPVTDEAVLNRLKEDVRDKVLQIDLRALGIEDYGTLDGKNTAELFAGDQPMTISRYPNSGFMKIADLAREGNKEKDIRGTCGVVDGKFFYADDGDRSLWNQESEIWTLGYWFWDWANSRQQISKLDTEKKYIELGGTSHPYGYRIGQYFYAYNLLCEIDMPGEYYIDHESGILYFYPPKEYQEGNLLISILPTVVSGKSLEHFVMTGFRIDGCRKDAAVFNGTDITFCGNLICDIGGTGIGMHGSENLVFGNHLFFLGGSGISISGGNRPNLTEAQSAAVNNDIHHYGRILRVYAPGIGFSGCGLLISQNRISNAPHCAVMFGGNENKIEFNEIYDVCNETNDAGAIYCGRDWTQRGNLVKNNYLHDITGFEGNGCVGVYLDDMLSSVDIVGNLFVRVTRAAMIGGGRDCSIVNNIFVDCHPTLHVDARALGWCSDHADGWLKENEEKGTLSGIDYKSELWSKRYPKLHAIMEGEPKAPEGNSILRNIVIENRWDGDQPAPYDGSDASIEDLARKYLTMDDNVIGDYRLLLSLDKGDAAIPFHFDRIPVEQIGLFRHSSALAR